MHTETTITIDAMLFKTVRMPHVSFAGMKVSPLALTHCDAIRGFHFDPAKRLAIPSEGVTR